MHTAVSLVARNPSAEAYKTGNLPKILIVHVGRSAADRNSVDLGHELLGVETSWTTEPQAGWPFGQFDLTVINCPAIASVDYGICIEMKRRLGAPVIIVGPDNEIDRILSLELGADDYVSKPVHPRELTARIRSILRTSLDKVVIKNGRATVGKWSLDDLQRSLLDESGATKRLTNLEYQLLRYMLDHANKILSRTELELHLNGTGEPSHSLRSVDVSISRLRERLEDIEIIRTVRGRGYMFASRR